MENDAIQWLLIGAGIIAGLKPLCDLIYNIFKGIFRGRDWLLEQDKQSDDMTQLKKDTDKKLKQLDDHYAKEIHEIKSEQTLIIYGNLACLKGLAEQGCNGPVHDAINKIEKYLNQKAHED